MAPRVLGTLVRRHGYFGACEDAVQEALLAAAVQRPDQGTPDNPYGWLVTVASRRLTDRVRSEATRRRREKIAAAEAPVTDPPACAPAEEQQPEDHDDALTKFPPIIFRR